MKARFTIPSLLAVALIGWPADARAGQQQTLQHVKDLYTQAAYEDALGVLARLRDTESVTDAARYRAACLVALGRIDEAQKVVASIVESHPEYHPNREETSPRIVDLFDNTRRQLLPDIARRMYADAKAAMDRNEPKAAIEGFSGLIAVLDDPELLEEEPTLSELKMLASGFLELTSARLAKTEEQPKPEKEEPAENTAPAAPPLVTPAVPVSQQLPQWAPPDTMGMRWEFAGAVRVSIGVDGKVVSAVIEDPVHPAYDGLLLVAARGWTYQPARQDGLPVASERIVQVVLKPR